MGDCHPNSLDDVTCWEWFEGLIKIDPEVRAIVNPSVIPKEARNKHHIMGPPTELDRWNPDVVSYWESWQGNIWSDIVVVGQDWGSWKYYLENGANESGYFKGSKANPTNENIIKLFASIGLVVDPPGTLEAKKHHLYFTNAILCTKNGTLNAPVKAEWFKNCREMLRETIDMVNPKIVISLGVKATDSVLRSYMTENHQAEEIREFFRLSWPDRVDSSKQIGNFTLYPVYHCGSYGRVNRPWNEQLNDWKRIAKHPDWADICRKNLALRMGEARDD